MCEALGLPFAPIARPGAPVRGPRLDATGGRTPVSPANGIRTKVPNLPIEMDGTRFGTRLDIPKVGEHTREVLQQLGYDAAAIVKLAAEGIVHAP